MEKSEERIEKNWVNNGNDAEKDKRGPSKGAQKKNGKKALKLKIDYE